MRTADDKEKVIFHAARAITEPSQRETYVNAACEGDGSLRQRIESLLAAVDEAGPFMESPLLESQDRNAATVIDELEGTTIGPYQLLEKIGEGGFGVVYMAEQTDPLRRRIALKIIKQGMDTKQVVARFDAERQALARMEHPNIAKVFDAGAAENGRPYFVMELVRGISLIEFCDQRQLTTEERLSIFIDVCGAIQHAHQKGIIHRDIKPTNVLVSTNGDQAVPKIIDFGIAKATQGSLTDKTLFTQFRQFIGTPIYMSPEQSQLSSIDVDTRSDVYSLGVLLYELLTSTTPLRKDELRAFGYDEICKLIRDTVFATPSKRISSFHAHELSTLAGTRRTKPDEISARIRGDLDWIVMKAIEKDRALRYASADALAEDIRRHLRYEPTTASPPGAWYTAKRFARRNRRLLFTGGVLGVTLLLATLISTWQVILATKATAKASEAEHFASKQFQWAVASESAMRRNLYASEMVAAKRALDQFDTQRTIELLEKYLPQNREADFRHFEWRALWYQTHRSLFQMKCDPNGPAFTLRQDYRDMRFSPDGRLLASASTDGAVRLWDFDTRQEIWHHVGGQHCNHVDFTSDGRFLLAKFYDDIEAPTLIWDVTNRNAPTLVGNCLDGVRFWSDDRSVVGMDGSRYDFSGKLVEEGFLDPSDNTYSWPRTYSADWTTLATHDRIWDVLNKKPLAKFESTNGFISPGSNGIAISPNDSNIVVRGIPSGVFVHHRNGKQVRKLSGTGGTPVAWMSFSAKGTYLAVRLAIGGIQVFETSDWDQVDLIPVPAGNSVCFSSTDDELLVAGSRGGTIRAFRISEQGAASVMLDHDRSLLSMKFSPDGQYLVVGMSDGAVCFWDVKTRSELFTTPAKRTQFSNRPFETSFGPDYVAISPNSRFAAIIGPEDSVSIWDIESRKVVGSYQCDRRGDIYRNEYYAVTFSQPVGDDGSCVLYGAVRGAMGSDDGSQPSLPNVQNESWRNYGHIDVWDWRPRDDGQLVLRTEHPGQAKCLSVASNGKVLAGSRLYGNAPVLWKLPEMQPLPEISMKGGWDIEISPDGSKLALAGGNEVKIWDFNRGESFGVLPHTLRVEHVSWSPDSRRLVSSDIAGNTNIWDVPAKNLVAIYRGTIAAFSPDGKSLAVGGPGSEYNGDEQNAGIVTLHFAPTTETIDGRH